jgi:hypothetical protein
MIESKAVPGRTGGREGRRQSRGTLESATYGRIKLSYVALDMIVVVLRTVAREVRGEWRYTVLLYEREGAPGEGRFWKGGKGGCVDQTLWEHETSLKVDEKLFYKTLSSNCKEYFILLMM